MDISDSFGMNDLQDRLKTFCREQSMDVPQFWIIQPDGIIWGMLHRCI